MAIEVSGATQPGSQRPSYINLGDELTKGLGNTEETGKIIADALQVIGGVLNVDFSKAITGARHLQVGNPNGSTGIPSIDDPLDPKRMFADLAALIADLRIENQMTQSKQAQNRIENMKGKQQKEHEGRMNKINESLEKMDKAKRSGLFNKIFGWIMAAVQVIAAIVVGVASGGTASGLSLMIAGAAISVALQVANTTGLTKLLTKGIEDMLRAFGVSKKAAQMAASLIVAIATAAAMIASGCMSGAGLHQAVKGFMEAGIVIAETIEAYFQASMLLSTAVGMAGTAWGGVTGYQSTQAEADVTEAKKFVAILQQMMDELQEELEQLFAEIQDNYSAVGEILSSELDALREILNQTGQMI